MKGGQKRGQDRTAHHHGQKARNDEMQAEEGREDGEGPGKDAARDLFGGAGQATHAVLDVMGRAEPAATRPESLGHEAQDRAGIAALEHLGRLSVLPGPWAAPVFRL
jgi:hypothetical protein